MDDDLLENYTIEVDYRQDGPAWFVFWHENCGKILIEDLAQRMLASLHELWSTAAGHDKDCDR